MCIGCLHRDTYARTSSDHVEVCSSEHVVSRVVLTPWLDRMAHIGRHASSLRMDWLRVLLSVHLFVALCVLPTTLLKFVHSRHFRFRFVVLWRACRVTR
jgi:hypothetical protein